MRAMLEPRALREPTAAAAAEGAAAGTAAAAAGSAGPPGAGMAEKKKDGKAKKGRKGKGPGKKPAPTEEGEAPGSATGKPAGRCGGRAARRQRAPTAPAGLPHRRLTAGLQPAPDPAALGQLLLSFSPLSLLLSFLLSFFLSRGCFSRYKTRSLLSPPFPKKHLAELNRWQTFVLSILSKLAAIYLGMIRGDLLLA